jgi:hypothetical protein
MVSRPTGHMSDAPNDRLASLRAPRADVAATRKSPVRVELLVGMVLIAGGVLVALSLGRDGDVPAAVERVAVESITEGTASAPLEGGLLADETLVAVALDTGQFPPGLVAGDRVMVTVVPDFDTGGAIRSLESIPVVVAVSRPDDITGRIVVTLRTNRAVPKVVAGSKTVLLSVVGGGS